MINFVGLWSINSGIKATITFHAGCHKVRSEPSVPRQTLPIYCQCWAVNLGMCWPIDEFERGPKSASTLTHGKPFGCGGVLRWGEFKKAKHLPEQNL